MTSPRDHSRRDFLKAGATAAVAAGVIAGGVHAAGSDEIKVGLIGCGGRGTQAMENVLQAAKGVKIVALADAFQDRVNNAKKHITNWVKNDKKAKEHGNSVDVENRTFVGLDAYKKLIDTPEVNYVILATPPGFRPLHIQAAVNAKKHIFTEKPVAVDGPGIVKVLESYVDANNAKLGVAAGTQRRHQTGYLETLKRIHNGDIGEIVGGRCAWNQGILWRVPRKKEWSDLEYQMRNWYNFTWICGDHIVEQHVHNIDVINWATKSHPVKASGMGFRTRTDKDYGHIFDFFSVDFEYPNGVHVISQCRQISGCDNDISEFVKGTKGTSQINAYRINDKQAFNRRMDNAPYVQEHTDLIKSIRDGKPINELKNVAESTLAAIMGRMSAYTGKTVTWDMAMKSKQVLMPENLAFDMKLPEPSVAMPGKTEFI